MDYELINSLGNAIDNVYNYSAEDFSRKTKAKLLNDSEMTISFVTIVNVARESDLHRQVAELKKEGVHYIKGRLNSIKKDFKERSGRPLKTKKCTESDSFETLTVSPYSHHRTYKFCYSQTFEVS
tara:strand:- start:8 stop:382 length:375 start_codon:yes stop_codon:yes gene_type:complete